MAFPLPNLLSDIEDLLQDVQWLDGLILVTDSERASFVSFSQVDPLLRRLRERPRGLRWLKSSVCRCWRPMAKGRQSPYWCVRGMAVFGWG